MSGSGEGKTGTTASCTGGEDQRTAARSCGASDIVAAGGGKQQQQQRPAAGFYERCLSGLEAGSLKDLDPEWLKGEIRRWAKAVVTYARQLSGRLITGSSPTTTASSTSSSSSSLWGSRSSSFSSVSTEEDEEATNIYGCKREKTTARSLGVDCNGKMVGTSTTTDACRNGGSADSSATC